MSVRARLDRAARILDQPPPRRLPGQAAIRLDDTADDQPPKVCEYGNPRCGAVPVRQYIGGYYCAAHPAGRPAPRTTTEQEQ